MATDARFDFENCPVAIPMQFRKVPYEADRFPGSDETQGLESGANCQLYAYSFLRHHGLVVPNFRSSELWDDRNHTVRVEAPAFLDLVLVNSVQAAWGAHVGVHIGSGLVLHLSKKIGWPAIETLGAIMLRPEYRFLIGAKRALGGKAAE